jgi:4-amino-4-deoxy-L-arabinose transferase-like glycosyltransferase
VTVSRVPRVLLVTVVLLAALAIRVAHVETTPYHAINDAGTYNRLASMVARYGDYHTGSGPRTGAGNSRGPTAYFPPGFPYVLAVSDLLTGHEKGGKSALHSERIEQALIGTLAVGLIGLVALEAFGSGVALTTLILAAVYPVLIEESGLLLAENLLVVFELAATWTALRARRASRSAGWIIATGVLTGLATLTHENAILMLLPLAAAVAIAARPWRGMRPARGPAVGAIALLVVSTALTIAPWTIRNGVELHRFLPVSDETGITLVGTYNPASAAFSPVPYKWRIFSQIPQDTIYKRTGSRYTEMQLSSRLESQALNYIGNHPLSPLDVAFHNTMRMLELEGSFAWRASAYAMGLSDGTARIGIVGFWIVGLLALAGLFTRPVREGPKWLWGIPVLLGLSALLVNMETPRFREPVDPFLILLAACAVNWVVAAVRERRFAPLRWRSRLSGAPVGRGRRAAGLPADGELVEMGQGLA